MRNHGAAALGEKQAQAADRMALFAIPRTVEPKQAKRKQRIVSRRALSRSRRHDGGGSIAGRAYSPNVSAGKGVLQIRGGSQRRHRFIRKLLSQHFAEAGAKLLAS